MVPFQWAKKLQVECSKVKLDLDQNHLEEKRLAQEAINAQSNHQLYSQQNAWLKERDAMISQVGLQLFKCSYLLGLFAKPI
jgi:uncharacterized protein YecT (DUF1311 family)